MKTTILCPLLLMLCLTCFAQERAPLYIAEGLFLVDDEIVQSYMRDITDITNSRLKRNKAIRELHKDLNYTISEVNKLFSLSSSNDLNITIYVRKIEILSSGRFQYPNFIEGTENGLDVYDVLDAFGNFLRLNNSYTTYQYDFAILYTGFDLYRRGQKTRTGCENIGRVCYPKTSFGVVRFYRMYNSVLHTAHEILHILGSEHDTPASQYIMVPFLDQGTNLDLMNPWLYKKCSESDIKETLNDLGDRHCLLSTHNDSYQVSVSLASYQGKMFDVDEICRRYMNNTSAFMHRKWTHHNHEPPGGDELCRKIRCSFPGSSTILDVFASEGMVCNVNKGCSKGLCVLNRATNQNITPDCLYGDQPIIEIPNFTGTCADLFNTYNSSLCYEADVNQTCCASCKTRHTTTITGCEYGDKWFSCGSSSLNIVCHNSTINNCCETCRDYVNPGNGKRSVESSQVGNIEEIRLVET